MGKRIVRGEITVVLRNNVKDRKETLKRLRNVAGVTKIEQVFSDAGDDVELASIFAAYVTSLSKKQKVIAELKQDPDVKNAYEPPARKLVRKK